jgi:pimeloyl-ACP methyl ester carboxylesterase
MKVSFILKKRDFSIADTGIDSVEKVTLGKINQSILIQAQDTANPVLLFLHGGPCMPIPGVASRGQDYAIAITTKELVKHFVVVFWDQRGAGKSFDKNIPTESMRVDQFISDCNELIDILKERFHKEKIYLAAHSWGTVIGLSIASKYPEKLHAYVGISQLLNWAENDRLCYDWVRNKAQEAHDNKTLRKLDELGLPPYTRSAKQWIDFRSPLMKYKSMIYESETIKNPGMLGAFRLFLNSSEYSLKDIFHAFSSSYKLTYTQEIVEDFAKINLHSIKKINVPIFLLHGKWDVHVNSKPVEVFFKALDAPFGKKMLWYDKSSHLFHPEDAQEIEKLIIEAVKTKNV